jgi:hypothetical protein
MARKITTNPIAIGNPSVISGMRPPLTTSASDFVPERPLPQTRQRSASSLTRVPQVGQIFLVSLAINISLSLISQSTGAIIPEGWENISLSLISQSTGAIIPEGWEMRSL